MAVKAVQGCKQASVYTATGETRRTLRTSRQLSQDLCSAACGEH